MRTEELPEPHNSHASFLFLAIKIIGRGLTICHSGPTVGEAKSSQRDMTIWISISGYDLMSPVDGPVDTGLIKRSKGWGHKWDHHLSVFLLAASSDRCVSYRILAGLF